MTNPELVQRIRTIFLQERSFVSIAEAAMLLGWPRGEMRAAICGGSAERIRQQHVRTLKRLFEIFEGNDAAEEVRRLKMEDQGF